MARALLPHRGRYVDDSGRRGTAGILTPEIGEANYDARNLLVLPDDGRRGRPPAKRAAASEWLATYLFHADGHERLAREVEEDARAHGVTSATLKRAAEDMGVEKRQHERQWWWRLPSDVIIELETDEERGDDGEGAV